MVPVTRSVPLKELRQGKAKKKQTLRIGASAEVLPPVLLSNAGDPGFFFFACKREDGGRPAKVAGPHMAWRNE